MELVSAHPDFFAGGIILGPGYMGAKRLEEALKAGGKPMADKKFFVAYYESEHPSTVAAAKNATKLLGAAGASVFHQAFQGRMHAPPPAFHQHLPLWVQILLQGKK